MTNVTEIASPVTIQKIEATRAQSKIADMVERTAVETQLRLDEYSEEDRLDIALQMIEDADVAQAWWTEYEDGEQFFTSLDIKGHDTFRHIIMTGDLKAAKKLKFACIPVSDEEDAYMLCETYRMRGRNYASPLSTATISRPHCRKDLG